MYNSIMLTGIAAALADGLGVSRPKHSAPPISALEKLIRNYSKNAGLDRILMYNPDAVGLWHYQKYTEWFLPVQIHTQLALPLLTVMPSVTPVCFATMYTGTLPEVHGIQKYEKPVIKIDSIFDSLLEAGKKCAIASSWPEASMSKIFLERDMDYYIFDTVEKTNDKVMELIEADKHDFITVYNGNYDKSCHASGPESDESLAELRNNIEAFKTLALAAEKYWASYDTLIAFAPDHGIHKVEESGKGTHGSDMEEDLNIMHYYGIQPCKSL